MAARIRVVRVLVGAVAGLVLASLAVVPAVAAGGDGAGPALSAGAFAPSSLVLGVAGSTGTTVEVEAADVDGVSGVTARLVDPVGVVRATSAAALTSGTTTAGRWTAPPVALAVGSPTGEWRVETTACDAGGSCTTAVLGALDVRRDAAIVSSSASPARVVQGRTTTVGGRLVVVVDASGRLVGLAGTTVALDFRPSGTSAWQRLRSVRTGADGRVATTVTPTRTGSWRLAHAGSATYRAVEGTAASVDVSAVRTWTFGHSVRGRALKVTRIGDPSAPRRVLVVGSLHGNERAGLKVVSRLRLVAPPQGVVYFLVPNLNPDGSAANTRQNARGVDLNRNFPKRWHKNGRRGSTYYPGPRASSEPESRAAQRLIRSVSPTLTVWYHQHMNLIDPAAGPRSVARAYGTATRMRVDRLAAYAGSASTWQGARSPSRPVLVVELPRTVGAAMAARHARAVRTVSVLPG